MNAAANPDSEKVCFPSGQGAQMASTVDESAVTMRCPMCQRHVVAGDALEPGPSSKFVNATKPATSGGDGPTWSTADVTTLQCSRCGGFLVRFTAFNEFNTKRNPHLDDDGEPIDENVFYDEYLVPEHEHFVWGE